MVDWVRFSAHIRLVRIHRHTWSDRPVRPLRFTITPVIQSGLLPAFRVTEMTQAFRRFRCRFQGASRCRLHHVLRVGPTHLHIMENFMPGAVINGDKNAANEIASTVSAMMPTIVNQLRRAKYEDSRLYGDSLSAVS